MLERPSLSNLQRRAVTDGQTRVTGAAPALRRGLFGSLLTALAAAVHGLYGFLVERSRQCTPYTATGIDLEEWAGIWGVVRKQPSFASGNVTLTGEPGAPILSDTRLQSTSGAEYLLVATVEIGVGGSVSAEVEAAAAGKAGNVEAGASLSFVSPLPGVDAEAEAPDGIGGGADLEGDDSLRNRMLREIQDPPQGGSKADYEKWALQVGPITRAWCFPIYNGPGSVRLYVVNDSHVGAELASAGDVDAVFDYIDAIKPVGVVIEDPENPGEYINGLEVMAPAKAVVDFEIDETPDDPAVRSAMQAAIADLFRREAKPEGSIALNKIITALGSAPGVQNFTLVAPVASPSAGAGEILVPGDFDFA